MFDILTFTAIITLGIKNPCSRAFPLFKSQEDENDKAQDQERKDAVPQHDSTMGRNFLVEQIVAALDDLDLVLDVFLPDRSF